MSSIIALGPELGRRESLRMFGILHLEPLLVERGLDMESLAMIFTQVRIVIQLARGCVQYICLMLQSCVHHRFA